MQNTPRHNIIQGNGSLIECRIAAVGALLRAIHYLTNRTSVGLPLVTRISAFWQYPRMCGLAYAGAGWAMSVVYRAVNFSGALGNSATRSRRSYETTFRDLSSVW